MRGLAWLYVLGSLSICQSTAAAELEDSSGVVPAEEIVQTLQAPRTRGLVKVPGKSPAPADSVARIAFPNVEFALNSAELLPAARAQLNEIGRALNDVGLVRLHFEVRGHTDVSGSPRFNQQLSQDRAAAVRSYLVARFALDAQRLRVRGVGADELRRDLPGADPGQRRVELIRR